MTFVDVAPNVLNVSIMPSQEVGFHEATHVILLDTFQEGAMSTKDRSLSLLRDFLQSYFLRR